ncbi:hypothetical protein RQP46_009818 [Phenoliferia psychrophenolica]
MLLPSFFKSILATYLSTLERPVRLSSVVGFENAHFGGHYTVHILAVSTAQLNPTSACYCLPSTTSPPPIMIPLIFKNTNSSTLTYSLTSLPSPPTTQNITDPDDSFDLYATQARYYLPICRTGIVCLLSIKDSSNVDVRIRRNRAPAGAPDEGVRVLPCPPAGFATREPEVHSCLNPSLPESRLVDLAIQGYEPLSVSWRTDRRGSKEPIEINTDGEDGTTTTGVLSVPMNVSLTTVGRQTFFLDSVTDGCGNVVSYDSTSTPASGEVLPSTLVQREFVVHAIPEVMFGGDRRRNGSNVVGDPNLNSDDSDVDGAPKKKRIKVPQSSEPLDHHGLDDATAPERPADAAGTEKDGEEASVALVWEVLAGDEKVAVESAKRKEGEEEASRALVQQLAAEDARADKERDAKAKRAMDFAADLKLMREEKKKAESSQKEVNKSDGIVYKVVIDGDSGRTIEGDDDGDNLHHLRMVDEIFMDGADAAGCYDLKIKTVTYFINPALECRFEEAKRELIRAGRSPKEMILFHGTAAEVIPNIMEEGFKIPGIDGNQTVGAGMGVWLSQSPAVSVGYCRGGKKMYNMGAESDANSHDSFKLKGRPGMDIYIVRRSKLVLPAYVIEFTVIA